MAERESIVSRVQKLLAVAMNEGATEAERALAQERADALMAQHLIEQHELAKDDVRRSQVTDAKWAFNFDHEFADSMETLLLAVVDHTTCRAKVTYKYVRDEETGNATNRQVVVVGTPENIAYAERLWLLVFSELVRNMWPKWDDKKTFEANVYAFVRAGFKWKQIHEVVWDHAPSLINNPYPNPTKFGWGDPEYAGDGGKLKRAYHRELAARNEPKSSHTSRHGAYRKSYVRAYTDTIENRLWRMREAAKKSTAMANDLLNNKPQISKYALAMIDSKAESEAAYYRLFPDEHPAVLKARQEEQVQKWRQEEEAKRLAFQKEYDSWSQKKQQEYDAKQARKRQRDEAASVRYWANRDRQSYDSAGTQHGRRVAEKVNLRDDQNVSGTNRRELG